MTEIDLRSEAGRQRPRLIVRRDLRASLLYAISVLAVRTLPESQWRQALGWLDATADRSPSRQAADFRRFVAGYRAMFGADIPEPELRALAKMSGDRGRQEYLYLAATRRRTGWHPEIVLTGREHLDA